MVPRGALASVHHVKMHRNASQASVHHVKKHTNAPQKNWTICKNTIDMEHGTFRGAGLHVKTRYKWKTAYCTWAYLCSETSLFDDFNTQTVKSIVKNDKKTA